jgi:hypothetical protein
LKKQLKKENYLNKVKKKKRIARDDEILDDDDLEVIKENRLKHKKLKKLVSDEENIEE